MDDFIKQQGLPFFAHLLGRLYDQIVRGFAEWNEEAGIKAPPRTHSTMEALHQRGPLAVTELAILLRQSHPLVISWIRQLKELGLVTAETDPADGRRTIISLTDAGAAEVKVHERARSLSERAFRRLMHETNADVFEALWRIEEALRREPFVSRLQAEVARESEQ